MLTDSVYTSLHCAVLQQVVAMHAVARIMLDNSEQRSAGIPNIQASWVKEGTRLAQLLLDSGCNDLGGTLMNEVSVSQVHQSVCYT
jgi:2-iminoacetate synthase ThiH